MSENDPVQNDLSEKENLQIDEEEQAKEEITTEEGDTIKEENIAKEEDDSDSEDISEICEEIDPLQQALADLESFKDRYLRSAAELDNFRKRTARTRSDVREETLRDALLQFAPVMDNMRRALDQETQGVDALKEGIELIYDQLRSAFSTYGLEPIQAVDSEFDPNLHEAMMEVEDSERTPGTVIQEMEKGYTLNGKIVRPSRVVVSKAVSEEESPS